MVYSNAGSKNGIYFVQGENGQGFGLFEKNLGNQWVSSNVMSGQINEGESEFIDLAIDASDLIGGSYKAEVIVSSNDPENQMLKIPVNLEVTGKPTLSVLSENLVFDTIYVGQSTSKSITIENIGTDLLTVSDVNFNNSDFSVDTSSFELSPNETISLAIEFTPTSGGAKKNQLIFISNDVENNPATVDLITKTNLPPVINIIKDDFNETLAQGSESTQYFAIDNTSGGSNLEFELSQFTVSTYSNVINSEVFVGADIKPSTEKTEVDFSEYEIYEQRRDANVKSLSSHPIDLEEVLSSLDTDYNNLTNLITENYLFSHGVTGNNISDGGQDMYDGGNYFNSNLGGSIYYSDRLINTSPSLASNEYFTAKYDGLFVFSGDVSAINQFTIDGNLGADGSGSVDGATIEITKNGTNYIGFVKRVYNAGDPSVNHLIIVEDNGIVNHEFSTNTDSDFHRVNGLSGIDNLHYLLFAGSGGKYYDNSVMTNVMDAYLDLVDSKANWLTITPSNGAIPAGGEMEIAVNFNTNELEIGNYKAQIAVNHNDPNQAGIEIPVSFNVIEKLINKAPVIGDQVFKMEERPFSNEIVGQIHAEDINGDTLSYQILNSSAPGAFNLSNSGELSVNDSTIIDFDLHKVIDLSIEVSDGKLQDSASISIIIEDIYFNEAPLINNQTFRIDENSPNGTVIGDLEAFDPNQDDLAFSMSSTEFASAVALSSSGVLTITDSFSFDYELNSVIDFYVNVSDGELTDSAEITILINDLVENKAPIIDDQDFEINENSPLGSEIGILTANDDQGDELTYSLRSSEIEGAVSLSNSGLLAIADSSIFDYESTNSFSIAVSVTDGEFTDSAVVVIRVMDVNENTAPIINDQDFEIEENSPLGTEIGKLTANDAEGDNLSYSLTTSEIEGAVSLSNSGLLTIADSSVFDYESTTSFSISVSVTDGDFTDSALVVISVLNVNENTAPSINLQDFEINENSPLGAEIGILTANDAEGDDLTYSLGSSEIEGAIALTSSGVLTIADSTVFDYESYTSFSIGVNVTDGEFTDSARILITILDVSENTAPTISNQTFEVEENANNGFEIGDIVAVDTDNDSLSFTIIKSQIEGAFNLSENGVLSILDSSLINYETHNSTVLIVEVSDGQLTNEAIITIKIIEEEDEVLRNRAIQSNLSLYPNPVVDELIIAYNFENQSKTLYVIDVRGQTLELEYMINAGELIVNTNKLVSGVYQLIIKDGNKMQQARFIKK